tara:strand:+ start:20317 stop:23391 length:3075 start_codon:yes stop_codon:yes gene_type:complete
MAAISQQIPNLLGGVSQQPDPIKLPGQVRSAKNVLLDPTFGCKKRPPTKFIKELATDIPETATWFPIIRDERERYVVCIYKDSSNATQIKVWEADTGTSRTVTVSGDAANYLTVSKVENLKTLTINDYTLLCNTENPVSMSTSSIPVDGEEALIVVNQVAYNTNYTIDFLKDGQAAVQEKVYKAKKLTISPGSFTEVDGGNCTKSGSVTSTKTSGTKTGLGFTITTNCRPTLVTDEEEGEPYPTKMNKVGGDDNLYGAAQHGDVDARAVGSYLYSNHTVTIGSKTISFTFEMQVENIGTDETPVKAYRWRSVSINSYTGIGWTTGLAFSVTHMDFQITAIQSPPTTSTYSYKSVYTAKVRMNNAGQHWRAGDTVTETLNGKTYTITVEEDDFGFNYATDNQVTYTSATDASNGTLNIGAITSALTAGVSALADYTATAIGNVVHIKRDDARSFNIQARGGTTNNALEAIKGSVNDISMLPAQGVPGMVLMVRNSQDSDNDDYFVKFVSSSGDIPGMGAWEETVKPGIPTDLNHSTMPHVLIRESNGDFTVRPLSSQYDEALHWAGREVGDENTNPAPTFVDRSITDMFFFMNRLGFLSGDTVIMSQPGDFFNFFQSSAIALSDADPIDMSASSTKPATLKAALGTAKGLLLFAENSQFLLSTTETAFGPSTVKMTEISNYAYTSKVKPVESGVSVMFSTEADTYSKVFEMALDSIDNRPVVSENTRIIPEFIPPNLTLSTASANNSFVAYGDGTKTLYTFKFFNVGNERSLAGWTTWEFPANVRLLEFAHDTGFVVMYNDGSYILDKLEFLDDPDVSPISVLNNKFLPRIDNFVFDTDVTEVAGTSLTKLRFPAGSYVVGATPNVVFTQQGNATVFQRPAIQSDGTGYYVEVANDLAATPYILGLDYDMEVELPAIHVTNEKKSDRKNPPLVETVYLDLYLSGRYTADILRLGYDTRTVDLDVTQSDVYFADTPAVKEVSTVSIPTFCRGDYMTIKVKASDPLPASITSYSWEGHYTNRGINLL